jgi:hypothetical protein
MIVWHLSQMKWYCLLVSSCVIISAPETSVSLAANNPIARFTI